MIPAEQVAARRVILRAKMQEAIREFQKETGMEVGGITILHHYCSGYFDADMSVVTDIRVTLPEKVYDKANRD